MAQHIKPRKLIGPLNIYGLLAMSGIIGPVFLVVADAVAAFPSPAITSFSTPSAVWR